MIVNHFVIWHLLLKFHLMMHLMLYFLLLVLKFPQVVNLLKNLLRFYDLCIVFRSNIIQSNNTVKDKKVYIQFLSVEYLFLNH